MSLPKEGKPIPADLAREYLKTIAEALRAEAKRGKYHESFLVSPFCGPAFGLAADVLEAVADGKRNFGGLIEGRGLARPYTDAVTEVRRQAIKAHCKGEPITRDRAFELADEVLNSSKSGEYFYAFQRHHGHVIDLPFKGTNSPAWTRDHYGKG